jgi:hypothetical protein
MIGRPRRAVHIQLRQSFRQQTITGEHEWNSWVAKQQRVEKRKRADHSAESDPDCKPSAGPSSRWGGDLRPATFSPRSPIACTERCEQWNEVADRDKRQGESESARIRARRIFYFALHCRRIIPADVIPERNRDTDGQTAESASVFRRKRVPWNVRDAAHSRLTRQESRAWWSSRR